MRPDVGSALPRCWVNTAQHRDNAGPAANVSELSKLSVLAVPPGRPRGLRGTNLTTTLPVLTAVDHSREYTGPPVCPPGVPCLPGRLSRLQSAHYRIYGKSTCFFTAYALHLVHMQYFFDILKKTLQVLASAHHLVYIQFKKILYLIGKLLNKSIIYTGLDQYISRNTSLPQTAKARILIQAGHLDQSEACDIS